jgi:hypothetical protein
MIRRLLAAGACAAALAAAATPAAAIDNYLFGFSPFGGQQLILNGGAITLNAVDTGWLSSTGNHDASNDNYIVGDCATCGLNTAFNDYFRFDLSNVSVDITSAILSVGNGNGYAAGPLSTFSLFDVTSSLSSLDVTRPQNDAGGIAIFNDLQSGVLYGSRSITNVVQNSQVDTDLNLAAIAALNRSRGGQFAIGGTLRPGTEIPGGGGAIPEPTSWALMILGFGAAGSLLRRRRTAAA